MKQVELAVIGGGPAGLAAAIGAYRAGLRNILILERDIELGGILNQCIHNGFGLHHFHEELTGPEYAKRYIDQLENTTIEVQTGTMVLQITQNREIHAVSQAYGYEIIRADSIVLAMGCRERSRGPVGINGDRGSGVFTAGTAQRYINLEGKLVGRRVVILGSGDIGLIMARRMTLEGAKVLGVYELMPYSNGLNRNLVQCLQDFDIPLYLSHTVTKVHGKGRLDRVTVAQVGADKLPVSGTEKEIDCDTLLLSVGLIPENELTRQAGVPIDPRTNGPVVYENRETLCPGVFAGGNVLHVHDLVDFVSDESEMAGAAAAAFVQKLKKVAPGTSPDETWTQTMPGESVSYVVPQRIRPEQVEKSLSLYFRVRVRSNEAKILVQGENGASLTFPKSSLAPSQMEKITLPAAFVKGCGKTLTVSVLCQEK